MLAWFDLGIFLILTSKASEEVPGLYILYMKLNAFGL